MCISRGMKSLAEALTRALVTTVRVYCQRNSTQGLLDTGQGNWLPPKAGDLGPWLVVFPGCRAGSGREAGHLSQSSCWLYWWPEYSPPQPLPLRLKKQHFFQTVRGRQGQASKSGLLQQKFLSLQKHGLWCLLFFFFFF